MIQNCREASYIKLTEELPINLFWTNSSFGRRMRVLFLRFSVLKKTKSNKESKQNTNDNITIDNNNNNINNNNIIVVLKEKEETRRHFL